jgi:hypothetical protein
VSNTEQAMARVRELVDEYRATCLWFLREDYYPRTPEEALRVLKAIGRHGDVRAFQKAEEVRRWLSPGSSSRSAG